MIRLKIVIARLSSVSRLILIRFVIRFLILFICLFTSSLDSSLISRLKFNEDISSQLIEFVTRKPYSRNILFSLYVGSRNRIIKKKKSLSYMRNTSTNDQFFVHTFRIKKIETEPTEHYLRNSILL